MKLTISGIAGALGLCFQGDGSRRLAKVASWNGADDTSLVFFERERAADFIAGKILAGCAIAPPGLLPEDYPAILSEKPKLDFARAAALLAPRERSTGNRHATALVAPDAEVAGDVQLGPFVVVGARTRIASGCILKSGVVIGEECALGENCILHPNVVIYPHSCLGNRVILHAGVVIGADGFGYVFDGHAYTPFPQTNRIILEDDVEIGANTTLDRGSLEPTRIGMGTKIDNLVQVAHNVQIGRHVVIAAQTGISGSCVIEDHVVIGGQVGIGDHARIQTGAIIGAKAGILAGKIVRGGEVYWGIPIRPLREFKRINYYFGRLPDLKSEIESLKKTVASLQHALEDRKTKPED
jgi:UDP-3-O-[3-hydroxymyristoyl] glucosamine N-acyltransferase